MSRDQIITGTYTFEAKATINNITTQALINGVDISDLYDQIYTYPQFAVLNASLQQNSELLDEMVDTQEGETQ